MLKVLFLIHDLGRGGAEKVLVNLVNNMDKSKFDISVVSLFGGGVNEQFLSSDIKYRSVFPKSIPGNSKLMKLFTPKQLHKFCVKENYDIEVSYLEGPSARVISGCSNPDTKLVCWYHCTENPSDFKNSFRSKKEAEACYKTADMMVYVSNGVKDAFQKICPTQKNIVLYNTNDSNSIIAKSSKPCELSDKSDDMFHWCSVGRLIEVKGYDRMLRIQKRLLEEGYKVHFHALGVGNQQEVLEKWCIDNNISNSVTFWGYQTNPYKYVSKCDLFVCASHSEGFSTAATEALIVGTPVCTVEVSGMKELLGNNNEYGIVTDNDENALYEAIKKLIEDPTLLTHYKKMADIRGETFSTKNTVKAVEDMLLSL